MAQINSSKRAFTIIELLVVVAIIALLVGLLLPAMAKAREQARVTQSQGNMRNLVIAHAGYASDYDDGQFTLIDARISTYGSTPTTALNNYQAQNGQPHPIIYLGWGYKFSTGQYVNWELESAGLSAYQPITFIADPGTGGEYFGSFRLNNVQAFNPYVSSRFYDPVFYSPSDEMVWSHVQVTFDSPHEYYLKEQLNNRIAWSSYCLSPAAMFSPDVMANPERGGWKNPWTIPAGFRCPSFSQALYPSLKTHMLEHHWNQSKRGDCNPGFAGGTYDNCEPYYFNHGWESSPVTAFFDGSVRQVGVREAELADTHNAAQVGYGLWSRDTPLGLNGYFIEYGFDGANTSFHILTTDGIRGRDTLAR